MKKSFLAVALAAAFTTLTFAQSAPPQNPPSQSKPATTKAHKKGAHKSSKKQQKAEGSQSK